MRLHGQYNGVSRDHRLACYPILYSRYIIVSEDGDDWTMVLWHGKIKMFDAGPAS